MIIIYKNDAPSIDNCHLLIYIPDRNILEEVDDELFAGVRNDPVVSNKNKVEWFAVPEQYLPAPLADASGFPVMQTIGELNLTYYDADTLPPSEHIAKLKAVNPALAKPAVITRKYLGELYDINCFVTQDVKDKYTAGLIIIGDYVVVSFISEYPDSDERNIAIVTGKVFKSW